MITFCWLPPDRFWINVCMVGVLVRRASLYLVASSLSCLCCRSPILLRYSFSEAMEVLVEMSNSGKIPLPLRSSVIIPSPCSMALRGVMPATSSPLMKILPPLVALTPKMASISSVRCAPTKPPIPSISPRFSEKEMSLKERGLSAVRFSTRRISSPMLLFTVGKRRLASRPTIRLINVSLVSSAAG
ncbi:hypothetical protein SDC9_194446 [bioreactor metagenome]|uniref:Uncharacterized protein n=1 Tax=bioreactor metagenome TaxID=1076179 RepID=A0A645I692_9ZZZZ